MPLVPRGEAGERPVSGGPVPRELRACPGRRAAALPAGPEALLGLRAVAAGAHGEPRPAVPGVLVPLQRQPDHAGRPEGRRRDGSRIPRQGPVARHRCERRLPAVCVADRLHAHRVRTGPQPHRETPCGLRPRHRRLLHRRARHPAWGREVRRLPRHHLGGDVLRSGRTRRVRPRHRQVPDLRRRLDQPAERLPDDAPEQRLRCHLPRAPVLLRRPVHQSAVRTPRARYRRHLVQRGERRQCPHRRQEGRAEHPAGRPPDPEPGGGVRLRHAGGEVEVADAGPAARYAGERRTALVLRGEHQGLLLAPVP